MTVGSLDRCELCWRSTWALPGRSAGAKSVGAKNAQRVFVSVSVSFSQQQPSHFFRSDGEFLYDLFMNLKTIDHYSDINGRAIYTWTFLSFCGRWGIAVRWVNLTASKLRLLCSTCSHFLRWRSSFSTGLKLLNRWFLLGLASTLPFQETSQCYRTSSLQKVESTRLWAVSLVVVIE